MSRWCTGRTIWSPATEGFMRCREIYSFSEDGMRCSANYYLVDSRGEEHLAATGTKEAKVWACVPEPAFELALPLVSCVVQDVRSRESQTRAIAREDGVHRWMQRVDQLKHCSAIWYAVSVPLTWTLHNKKC